MSLDPDHIQQVVARLQRLVDETSADAQVERVHHLRTNTRRLEALLQAPPASTFKGKRKLQASLQRLRRRAGKIRDLDVQIAALEAFLLPDAEAPKQELLRLLHQKREDRAGQLRRRLNRRRIKKLQQWVQTAGAHLTAAVAQGSGRSAERVITAVRQRLARMNRPLATLSDRELHNYRIQCKRLRYRLEAIGDESQATRLVAQLKRIQDGVGKWHDWLTLTQNAEKLLPQEQRGVLAHRLQQATYCHRRQALRTIAAVRAAVHDGARRAA